MATQYNRYAAGRKTYGGGRSNPTSGTVDPTGYIDRAANNMASQRRSGLAQSAIQQAFGSRTPTGTRTADYGSPTGTNTRAASISYQPQYIPELSRPQATAALATGENFQLPNNPTGWAGEAAPGPMESQAPQMQEEMGVPLDPIAMAARAAEEADRERFLAGLTGQENDFRSAAARRLRQLMEGQETETNNLTDNFAARGMGRSGRYIGDRGQLEREFSGAQTDVNEGLTRNLNSVQDARAGRISQGQFRNQAISAEAADRAAQNPRYRNPAAAIPASPSMGGLPPGMGGTTAMRPDMEAIRRRVNGGRLAGLR